MTIQDAESDPDNQLLDRALPAMARLEASLADERESSRLGILSANFLDALTNLGHAIAEESEQLDALDLIAPGRWAAEEFHSKIISWILDPEAHHQQAQPFIGALLNATKAPPRLLNADWGAAQVCQEWENVDDGQRGYLDILVLDREDQNLIAIENKTFSQEHSNQLTRYRRALADVYPDFTRHHIFLSPAGLPAQLGTRQRALAAGQILRHTRSHPASPGHWRRGSQRECPAPDLRDDHQEKRHAGHQH